MAPGAGKTHKRSGPPKRDDLFARVQAQLLETRWGGASATPQVTAAFDAIYAVDRKQVQTDRSRRPVQGTTIADRVKQFLELPNAAAQQKLLQQFKLIKTQTAPSAAEQVSHMLWLGAKQLCPTTVPREPPLTCADLR
jgi:hypothetical protein